MFYSEIFLTIKKITFKKTNLIGGEIPHKTPPNNEILHEPQTPRTTNGKSKFARCINISVIHFYFRSTIH